MRYLCKNIWLIGMLLLVTSCEKWLDVKPKGQVAEDDLFASAEGFRNSLNGIYKAMGGPKLYGCDLSYGFVDVLAQYYAIAYCKPDVSYRVVIDQDTYDYRQQDVELKVNGIWKEAFNLVSNANNLLNNLEKTDSVMFLDGKGNMEYKMIKGEALALRASLHLDMLRLYAPAPDTRPTGGYVPYCDAFPSINFPLLPVDTVINRIIRDLERARSLTAEYDTTYKQQIRDVAYRLKNSRVTGHDEFLSFRGYRLNYYAVTGLLARANMYKGDKAAALKYAREIIYSGLFKFSSLSSAAKGNTKLYDDVVYAVYNNKLVDLFNYLNYESTQEYSYLVIKDRAAFFPEGKTDVRGGDAMIVNKKNKDVSNKYFEVSATEHACNNKLVPMLRLSEMYYIYAECAYALDVDKGDAMAKFADLRKARGISKTTAATDLEEMKQAIIADARKEFIGEGQLFYLYKRLGEDIRIGSRTIRMKDNFVLPVPAEEASIH